MGKLAALLFAGLLAGCAGMPTIDEERQVASSGFIGCAPAEIAVSDHQRYTWTATCRGKVFYCTAAPSATCTERLK